MPQTLASAEAVEEIAQSLISNYHPELATARMKFLFQEKAGKKSGKAVLGKVQKVSGVLEYFADADFIILVALDTWNELAGVKRTALVDHLLERCTGEEDPEDPGAEMKWKTREPDVNEFSTILQRYGAWSEDLTGFCAIAQSLTESDTAVRETRVTARSGSSGVYADA